MGFVRRHSGTEGSSASYRGHTRLLHDTFRADFSFKTLLIGANREIAQHTGSRMHSTSPARTRMVVNLTVMYEESFVPQGMVSDIMLIFCSFSCFEIHSIAIYAAPFGAHEIWWIYLNQGLTPLATNMSLRLEL